MVQAIKNINLGIVFLAEMGILLGMGMWGFSLHINVLWKILIGIGLPLLTAVVWGRFFSPKAGHPLGEPWNAIGEISIFLLGALAMYGSGHHKAGIVFGAIAIVSETLSLILE